MPEKTAYAPGEAIWVDLSTSDQAASAAFYRALLGRTATEPAPDMGGCASFELGGRKVAGLVPLVSEACVELTLDGTSVAGAKAATPGGTGRSVSGRRHPGG